jgi:hypothetical protein
VVASDAGHEISDGVLLAEVDVAELVVLPLEEDRLDDDPDCEDDVPVLALELVDVVPEPSVTSFAPQIAGLLTAEPSVFFK